MHPAPAVIQQEDAPVIRRFGDPPTLAWYLTSDGSFFGILVFYGMWSSDTKYLTNHPFYL